MTYDEYMEKYGSKDHVLIRMTDSFPFFKEKIFMENGKKRVETNYHIADGMHSIYINFEMPQNAISAEISCSPRFEILCDYEYPVFITNIGEKPFELTLDGFVHGKIRPDEVLAIHPQSMADETNVRFEEASLLEYIKKHGRLLAKKFGVGMDEVKALMEELKEGAKGDDQG